MADAGTKLERAMSSNELALQLPDSTSQPSRPGQPATPDQIQPCHNASRHSSAAVLWPMASRDLSASAPNPSRQRAGASVTPSDKLKKPKASRKGCSTKAANLCKRKLVDMYTTQQEGEKRSKSAKLALDSLPQAAAEKEPVASLRAVGNPAAEAEAASDKEHATALTKNLQLAAEEAAQCFDSFVSALAPLMHAHVRSKSGPPFEVTDDSETHSNGASDKVPARNGTVAGSLAADTASLLWWATAKPAPVRRQVPRIPLDRPGMWAHKIVQARAQVQEAISAPKAPGVSAAKPAPATEVAPAGLTAASLAAASPPEAVERCSTHASAAHRFLQALTNIAPAQKEPCASAAAAPHEQCGRGTVAPKGSAEGVSLQADSAAITPVRQQEAAKPPQCQLGSPRMPDRTPMQPAASPTRQQAPTVELASLLLTVPAGTPVTESMQKRRTARAQPAASAPLQGAPVLGSHRKKRPDASLGTCKALSAPLMLSALESALDDEHSSAAAEAAKPVAEVPVQQPSTTTEFTAKSEQALQPDGCPSAVPDQPSATEQAPQVNATAAAVPSCAVKGPSVAEQAPTTDAQAVGMASALPAAHSATELASPAAEAKPRKRRGRPLGSSKAARAKALKPALHVAGTEGKRPIKKSRKALEVKQAEAALASLDPEELPGLSSSEREAGAEPEGRRGCGGDSAQPEQAPMHDQGGMLLMGLGMVPVIQETPTCRRTPAQLGKCKFTGPDIPKIREDMQCPETLPYDLPSMQCLDALLNLSLPPTLPGVMFGGSICTSLLGSPLPRLDSPDYHHTFYGEAFNDLSLANLNEIADSSFSFGGCFNN